MIFMIIIEARMTNDEGTCNSNADKVADYAKEFQKNMFVFFSEPEQTSCMVPHTCSNKPNGEWIRIARLMTMMFEICTHLVKSLGEGASEITNVSLSRRKRQIPHVDLNAVGSKPSLHLCDCGMLV